MLLLSSMFRLTKLRTHDDNRSNFERQRQSESDDDWASFSVPVLQNTFTLTIATQELDKKEQRSLTLASAETRPAN
jgi:hypothetical protein